MRGRRVYKYKQLSLSLNSSRVFELLSRVVNFYFTFDRLTILAKHEFLEFVIIDPTRSIFIDLLQEKGVVRTMSEKKVFFHPIHVKNHSKIGLTFVFCLVLRLDNLLINHSSIYMMAFNVFKTVQSCRQYDYMNFIQSSFNSASSHPHHHQIIHIIIHLMRSSHSHHLLSTYCNHLIHIILFYQLTAIISSTSSIYELTAIISLSTYGDHLLHIIFWYQITAIISSTLSVINLLQSSHPRHLLSFLHRASSKFPLSRKC